MKLRAFALGNPLPVKPDIDDPQWQVITENALYRPKDAVDYYLHLSSGLRVELRSPSGFSVKDERGDMCHATTGSLLVFTTLEEAKAWVTDYHAVSTYR